MALEEDVAHRAKGLVLLPGLGKHLLNDALANELVDLSLTFKSHMGRTNSWRNPAVRLGLKTPTRPNAKTRFL